jgi:hypothetical protein
VSFHRNNSLHNGASAPGDTLKLSAPANEKSFLEDHLTVSTNWGEEIPVGEDELVVLELYLADAIDQLIAPGRKGRKGSSQARGPP